jgi:signal transduction histidine kinase
VLGSEDALLSVFGNLLSNAIRYTPGGGSVSVGLAVEGDFVCVEVTDTGIGMPVEVQGRIFDKFYRGPQARAVEAQGLGLGLSLVQQFVEVHDGRIEVTSVDGAGSTFKVWLPRAEEFKQEAQ